jgi:hypothetical protein
MLTGTEAHHKLPREGGVSPMPTPVDLCSWELPFGLVLYLVLGAMIG